MALLYLQEVLTQLTSRLASQLNDLTIQVVKEDWAMTSTPLATSPLPPLPPSSPTPGNPLPTLNTITALRQNAPIATVSSGPQETLGYSQVTVPGGKVEDQHSAEHKQYPVSTSTVVTQAV